jgi:predicted nucleic acid-binding protein
MSGKCFIDTNVLVYLFDSRTPAKQRAAGELLQRLADERTAPIISTQVLQETYAALTRKLGMDEKEALATLMMMDDASFAVRPVDVQLVWKGARRSIDDKLSFWDALIVEAARDAGCSILYTEDLQSGRSFDGVTIENPFV